MKNEIMDEQKKLANHMKSLTDEEREKKGFAMLCWLQGFETGYESAKQGTKEK